MRAFGVHILAELSECNPDIIGDLERVQRVLTEAAVKANAEIRERVFHRFYPHGVSGVVVIAESHLSIHTWPEYKYAALDIYTCGEHTNPWKACAYAAKEFEAGDSFLTVIERGISNAEGSFDHKVVSKSISKKGELQFA